LAAAELLSFLKQTRAAAPWAERDLAKTLKVDATSDGSIALEAHADYGLSKPEADKIVARTIKAVASWRREAAELRIPKAEQDLIARAFES
jgi:hypothetical protein